MDPRGYEVIPVSAPNDLEKAHHYLWRFWTEFPKAGHVPYSTVLGMGGSVRTGRRVLFRGGMEAGLPGNQ